MIDIEKVKTVISHEYSTRVKSKSFIWITVLGPLLMLLVMFIPGLIMYFSMSSTESKVAIVDQTGKFAQKLVSMDKKTFYTTNSALATLDDSVRSEELDGYVVIDSNFMSSGTIVLSMKGSGGMSLQDKIESNLGKIRENELLRNYGIDQSVFENINKSITVKQVKIAAEKSKKNEAGNSEFQLVLAYIIGFAIYMMLILYGTMVMRGVIEEKTNRIVEVLAASIRPFDFMLGKVIGIGLVGITQMCAWVVGGGIIMAAAGPVLSSFGISTQTAAQAAAISANGVPSDISAASGFVIPSVSVWVILAIIFFFIVGYFMYSTLYAAIGSAVDREDDANQIATPVMMLIIIPFLIMSSVMADPNSLMATLTSLFPFFSPMLMLARIIVTDGQLPLWQVLLSMVLCIATFIGCMWISARIYRTGILMYGKKPTIGMLWKWIRQSN